MRSRKLAISNVEKDFDKPMKRTAWEQAGRGWKQITNKTKDGAEKWSEM
jgi:hypothetical protein